MSLCDACRRPGRCCVGFTLNSSSLQRAETPLEALLGMAAVMVAEPAVGSPAAHQLGLPFLPLWRRPNGTWLWWCPLLGPDGRCTDYANRPWLCAHYQPGQDGLCAEWDGVRPAEAA